MTIPIDVIAGARPNFMKVAPVLRALAGGALAPSLVHTGQHYDAKMSDVFFEQLGIPRPDVHLGVGSGSHGDQTAAILSRYEQRLLEPKTRPAGVVVVGDVNSTLACTLAASKLGIPVAHVEAGLRSFDRSMPEEINRIVTDALADLLLVSEPAGELNLRAEGVASSRIVYVGNVMIDTLVREREAASALKVLEAHSLQSKRYVHVTLHRPSNVDHSERLSEIVALLERLATRWRIVFPIHPRTRASLERNGLLPRLSSLVVLPPQGYRENLALMADAACVLTDSGGVQEETTFLGVPCVTLRNSTERPVTVTSGTNILAGEKIVEVEGMLEAAVLRTPSTPPSIAGWDGRAAERVAAALVTRWT